MSHNNPFALDPSQRYPDINGGQQMQQPQPTGYLQPQPQQFGGYGQQQQQPQGGFPGQASPAGYSGSPMGQQSPMYAQPTGYGHTQSTGFQPSSQFGQYLKTQGTGLNFGAPTSSASYAGQQPGASSFLAPSPQPQQQQQQPAYLNPTVADLDPFSAQQRQMQQQQQMQGSTYQPQLQTTPQQQEVRQQEQYGDHPRTFMRNNKSSLESWNMDAWGRVKALLNQLERAWEGRKKMVMEWQTWALAMDDRDTCDKLRKEADENIDTIAAYTLQVKEIVESYRYSSDEFSRAQTRRALNEGLQSLPDWPLTLQAPPKLSDTSAARATPLLDPSPAPQQMNGFYQPQPSPQPQPQMFPQQQQPQPTGYGMQQQQSQPTGYGMQPSFTGYQQQQQPMQQQPQMTGMYGQPGMQMGMPQQQNGYRW